jgi:NADH-quinone oxidoreductase subunit L
MGVVLDPLTAFMLVMVTFVGFLIFLFGTAYMSGDERYPKFFCYLSLFASAMLGIVVSNSLLLTFIAWELVGLASYMLIGFWFERPSAAAAAKKAFMTTRVGDLGFLLGMVWLDHAHGSLLYYDGGAGFLENNALAAPALLAAAGGITLLLFAGAAGKSGQFPLHVWLPDAMEGPTPVSALIHAATMVAAGVFLMARIFPLLALSQLALTVVAFTGALTALLGAMVAVAQNDIKRVLAFSTVSQLGYMMLAVGVGAWPAAIFHLLAHAFFKALLFLGAGSVIHAAHHEQDMRFMGGLGVRMKLTFATFSIGMMALAGVPFFFSGFWSKEAVLHGAQEWPVSQIPFAIALVAVVLTAFYTTRLMVNVFAGGPRSAPAAHAVENGPAMTLPLSLLAVCAVLFGFLGTPAWPWLQAQLLPRGAAVTDAAATHAGGAPALMAVSVFLVALGIGLGWAVYGVKKRRRTTASEPDLLERRFPRLWRLLENRLYVDEFYAATIFRLNAALAALADWFDRFVIDGVVRLVAKLGTLAGFLNKEFDENVLNAGFNAGAEGLRGVGMGYSGLQSGEVHGYLASLARAFVVISLLALVWALFC